MGLPQGTAAPKKQLPKRHGSASSPVFFHNRGSRKGLGDDFGRQDWEDSWLIEQAEARAKRHRGTSEDLHAMLRAGLEDRNIGPSVPRS